MKLGFNGQWYTPIDRPGSTDQWSMCRSKVLIKILSQVMIKVLIKNIAQGPNQNIDQSLDQGIDQSNDQRINLDPRPTLSKASLVDQASPCMRAGFTGRSRPSKTH